MLFDWGVLVIYLKKFACSNRLKVPKVTDLKFVNCENHDCNLYLSFKYIVELFLFCALKFMLTRY